MFTIIFELIGLFFLVMVAAAIYGFISGILMVFLPAIFNDQTAASTRSPDQES
jgi:hypothetical protein